MRRNPDDRTGEPPEGASTRATVAVADTGRGLVRVTGELDLATEKELTAELVQAVRDHGPDIVIDVSEVSFCDARGLAVLGRAAVAAEQAEGVATLRGAKPHLIRLLRITALDRRFPELLRGCEW